ncbi:uncharacterized protein LOC143854836 [Tasmannia lanceolata]|uniref:uncharacterized protein LOC143854836 n=1 Tax=Tasmannia lanceolata TaxID=3420 RepID=UPI00406403BE
MEIPVMSRLSSFEAGINRLQNPSLISRIFQLSGIGETSYEFYSFWTLGALILAAIATFSSLIDRTKLVLFRFPKGNSVISAPLLLFEDDDETCSSSSDDEGDSAPIENREGQNFRVANSGKFDEFEGQICKLNSWQGNVVKLWDGLGLGLENSNNFISMWDLNKGEIIRSFFTGRGKIPAICMKSPAVLVSAGVELENMRHVALRVWDLRIGGQITAAVAEWQPRRRRDFAGIDSGGVEKVYVTDDVSSVAIVRDLRNVTSPLEGLTESDVPTWFDADAVMVGDGDGDEEFIMVAGK